MGGYSKLFGSILDSTVWHTDAHVRLVWITMLAMADRDGLVEAAVPGLAARARVDLPQCLEAIEILSSPDPYSRSPEHEGRRIAQVDGGWQLLNYLKYRHKASADEAREKAADRQSRKRERDRGDVTPRHAASRSVTPVTESHDIAEAEAEADQHKADPAPGDQSPPDRVCVLPHASRSRAHARESSTHTHENGVSPHGSERGPSPEPPAEGQGDGLADVGAAWMLAVTGLPWEPSDWAAALRWIGKRPEQERQRVAATVGDDPWCQANLGQVTPAHLRKYWGKYLSGTARVRPVEPQQEPETGERQKTKAEIEAEDTEALKRIAARREQERAAAAAGGGRG